MSRILRIGCISLCVILFSGCHANKYSSEKGYSKYVFSNRSYTFAIYNSSNRLVSHPLDDIRAAAEDRRKQAGKRDTCLKAITDVYVVAHGWNFSITEAMANYQNYIEIIDHIVYDSSVRLT